MIYLWVFLLSLWVILALHYFSSYREWKRQDKLRRLTRKEGPIDLEGEKFKQITSIKNGA